MPAWQSRSGKGACRARAWVERAFEVPQTKRISLFETTIRIVGGFLAAYDLTKDALYVEKARGIVDCMMPYLETSATGGWVSLLWGSLNGPIYVQQVPLN